MTTTTMTFTDEALDMINFFSQFATVSFAVVFALLTVIILLLIFKT